MLTLSGPVELLFLLCFIAAWICVVVSVMLVVCSLSVFLSMCLCVLCVLCLTVLVNCLLNAFVDEVNVFSLKVMVLFLGCVFFVASPSPYPPLLLHIVPSSSPNHILHASYY